MIVNRYIQRSIHMGTLSALFVLVSLSLFFLFVRELDDLGEGNYGLAEMLEFIALSTPGKLVEFMPLAALLGSLLSLGALASNSEIIAMQASGISMPRLLGSVLQAGLMLALATFLLADWVVPDSETSARTMRDHARDATTALQSGQGMWIKDESRVVRIKVLLPSGVARGVEIFQLDENGKLKSMLQAETALPVGDGWELRGVRQTRITEQGASADVVERLLYQGNLSKDLLRVLLVEPRQMSSMDLFSYLKFLDENRLDARLERQIFWRKIMAPATIVIMCLLAFPFVLGSQRHGNTGQRLMLGILLGLAFVVVDRLLTQLGGQFSVDARIVALAPNLMFLSMAVYLLMRKQSKVAGKRDFGAST